MLQNQLYKQIQESISRWLRSSEVDSCVEIDSGIAALSSVLGKRSENQDRTLFIRVKSSDLQKPSIAALVLCDGMGGMMSGGDCATLAISTFTTALLERSTVDTLEKANLAVRDANNAVYSKFQGRGGATLSAIVCSETNDWVAVNVGDSRIYALFNNGLVEQLTVDDTLEKQLADLNLPAPPPEFRQLLQYVGIGKEMEPRLFKPKNISDIRWLFITSDGAHSIPDTILQPLVNHSRTPKDFVFRLTELSNWLGGKDNATVASLAVGNNIFSSNGDLDSIEIWSVFGKMELMIVNDLSNKTPLNSRSSTSTNDVYTIKDTAKQEEVKLKRKPHKKNDSSIMVTASNEKYGDRIDSPIKGEGEKSIPQLKINFSEDS